MWEGVGVIEKVSLKYLGRLSEQKLDQLETRSGSGSEIVHAVLTNKHILGTIQHSLCPHPLPQGNCWRFLLKKTTVPVEWCRNQNHELSLLVTVNLYQPWGIRLYRVWIHPQGCQPKYTTCIHDQPSDKKTGSWHHTSTFICTKCLFGALLWGVHQLCQIKKK